MSEQKKLELAIIENIQRENLDAIEMARSFARLQDEFNFTQREIAQRLGKSREVVANALRLLQLPTEMQQAISEGKLSEGQARLLLSVDNLVEQAKLFKDILNDHLTVRAVSERIKALKHAPKAAKGPENAKEWHASPELLDAKERLEETLGTKVGVESSAKGGKIVIEFYSSEELAALLEKMGATQNDN
jgi:ParB family chromosome partitioning protein